MSFGGLCVVLAICVVIMGGCGWVLGYYATKDRQEEQAQQTKERYPHD